MTRHLQIPFDQQEDDKYNYYGLRNVAGGGIYSHRAIQVSIG